MTRDSALKAKVVEYYDQESRLYSDLYTKPLIEQEFYPANALRLEIVVERLRQRGVRSVLDVGCGTGQPLLRLLKEGFDARGFDFSRGMVDRARQALSESGHDPDRVTYGDLESDETIPPGRFDAVVATGVFPHNLDDRSAYANLRSRIAPGGFALVEYRNALMALFSINPHSMSFYWNELVRGDTLPQGLRDDALAFFADKFETPVEQIGRPRAIEYTEILARFHNPLTLGDELEEHGLSLVNVHYYHHHAAPPHLEAKYRKEFWESSLKRERTRDWRAMFMCSAFVAEIETA